MVRRRNRLRRYSVGAILLFGSLLAGCGGGRHRDATPAASAGAANRAAIAKAKAFHAAKKLPKGTRADCSGFVMAAYREAGHPLVIPTDYRKGRRVSAMLHEWSAGTRRSFRKDRPSPGDLVFFRDTAGPRRGDITHVGIVESVEKDGTVVFLHHMGGRIRRDRMNIARPSDPSDNAWLRRTKRRGTPALAGELFVAYARF